jgi:hypothetical protein
VRTFAVLGLLAALTAILAVGGVAVWNHGRNAYWWGTSDSQRVLLDDPMSAPDLLGLTLIREDIAGPVGVTEMASGAYVHRWFDPAGRPEQVLAELGAYAAAHGWRQEVGLSSANAWVGAKDLGGPTEGNLIINLERTDGGVAKASEATAVRVSVTYF